MRCVSASTHRGCYLRGKADTAVQGEALRVNLRASKALSGTVPSSLDVIEVVLIAQERSICPIASGPPWIRLHVLVRIFCSRPFCCDCRAIRPRRRSRSLFLSSLPSSLVSSLHAGGDYSGTYASLAHSCHFCSRVGLCFFRGLAFLAWSSFPVISQQMD